MIDHSQHGDWADRREERIRERMEVLRLEHRGEDNWIGYVQHDPGECVECDALRRLEREDQARSGASEPATAPAPGTAGAEDRELTPRGPTGGST